MLLVEENFVVNVYDFDGTIFVNNSLFRFWKYCFKKRPWIILCAPLQLINFLIIAFDITQDKSLFYSFVRFFPDIKKTVSEFWDENEGDMCEWYMKQKESSDIVVSASPDFLISEICNRLGINCIASAVCPKTGKCLGNDCKGAEKVILLRKHYPDTKIGKGYGDSESDIYLLRCAEEGFFVKNNSRNSVEMQKI